MKVKIGDKAYANIEYLGNKIWGEVLSIDEKLETGKLKSQHSGSVFTFTFDRLICVSDKYPEQEILELRKCNDITNKEE